MEQPPPAGARRRNGVTYELLRCLTLAFLKVPPEPHPPMGDPVSLRVFRAGRNYFRLRLAGWVAAQVLALAGILFWTAVIINVESTARAQKLARAVQPAPAIPPADANQRLESGKTGFKERITSAATATGSADKAGFKQTLVEFALLLPAWAFPLVWEVKISGFIGYLLQIPLTYAVLRLDYEMRWYTVGIVTAMTRQEGTRPDSYLQPALTMSSFDSVIFGSSDRISLPEEIPDISLFLPIGSTTGFNSLTRPSWNV